MVKHEAMKLPSACAAATSYFKLPNCLMCFSKSLIPGKRISNQCLSWTADHSLSGDTQQTQQVAEVHEHCYMQWDERTPLVVSTHPQSSHISTDQVETSSSKYVEHLESWDPNPQGLFPSNPFSCDEIPIGVCLRTWLIMVAPNYPHMS